MLHSLAFIMPDFRYEDESLAAGYRYVIGVDEAGRGPLAGPVVAAALLFCNRSALPIGLNDSKKLTATKRKFLHDALVVFDCNCYAIASATPAEIDSINILQATHLAMRRAICDLLDKQKLLPSDCIALVDGLPVQGLPIEHRAIVKGDAKSLSVAAASIMAKVSRDHLMSCLNAQYPSYGFSKHKGYGTAAHLAALERLGPCPAHRRSFAPVAASEKNFSLL